MEPWKYEPRYDRGLEAREGCARQTEGIALREARNREEKSIRQSDAARRRQEKARRDESEARKRVERTPRFEEDANRAEEARRQDEKSKQQREEIRYRQGMARDLLAQNKRVAWEEQREAKAKAREEEKKWDGMQRVQASGDLMEISFNPVSGTRIGLEVWLTEEEFNFAEAWIQHGSRDVRIAVCGSSVTGKSSLRNAFYDLVNNDAATPAGEVETTMITHYSDDVPHSQFHIPRVEGPDVIDWQQVNKQDLFVQVFHFIVLVYDIELTKIDRAIVHKCERDRIFLYIVCSKADTQRHIRNINGMLWYKVEPDFKLDGDARDADDYYSKRAQQVFIHSTRKNLEQNIQKSDLTKWDIFKVSGSTPNFTSPKFTTPKFTTQNLNFMYT